MRPLDTLEMAAAALWANPFRSLLTILGVVVGVGCVVSMLAIGAGARARVQDQIRAFGANVILVNPGSIETNGVRSAVGARHTLTAADARAIAELPTIKGAAPSVYGSAQIVYGAQNWATTINGTTPDHFNIREWPLKAGRMFSSEEVRSAAKSVIIGSLVAQRLFRAEDPVGKVVRIMNTPFTVIGVLAEKGTNGGGQNQDDVAFAPLSTATLRLIGSANIVNRDAVAYILASARSEETLTPAMRDVEALLRQRHKTREGADDFTVTSAASALAAQEASTRTISILLGSIAAVSLIVGGISIMNIMLVCVTERTPEIGLRLAIGAQPRHIRQQFLIEATVLCGAGGVIGAILGSVVALMIGSAFAWPVRIEPLGAVGSVLLAAAIGVFFGWYPARRAAALQPIAALKRL